MSAQCAQSQHRYSFGPNSLSSSWGEGVTFPQEETFAPHSFFLFWFFYWTHFEDQAGLKLTACLCLPKCLRHHPRWRCLCFLEMQT